MSSIFDHGIPQDISDVLTDKDNRIMKQRSILENNQDKTSLDIKLNIPGPIKNNDSIHQLFERGMDRFNQLLLNSAISVDEVMSQNVPVGNERFMVTSSKVAQVKQIAIEFEDHDRIGRLFDIDVLDSSLKSMSRTELGFPARKCLICGRPAKECARSRRHSVAELQQKIDQMYREELGDLS